MDLFTAAAQIVLASEGVFANDPQDPGGETKWGISRNAHPEISDDAWAAFTQADALAVYRSQYWDANGCGELPWGWALAVFDGAVNQGGAAVRMAQEALGVAQDGLVGPATIAAATVAAPEAFETFLALRLLAYARNTNFATYGKGWFKRIVGVAINVALIPADPSNGAVSA